jgi:hypothetical protein
MYQRFYRNPAFNASWRVCDFSNPQEFEKKITHVELLKHDGKKIKKLQPFVRF